MRSNLNRPAEPAARRPIRKIVIRTLACLLCLLIVGVVAVIWLLRSEPRHWKEHRAAIEATPMPQRAEQAEQVQQHVFNTLSSLSELPDGTVTLHVPINQANAWLDLKLPGWLANQNVQMPQGIRSPMVAIDGSNLVFAFEMEAQGASQIVSIAMEPRVPAPGQIALELKSVKGGRLNLPAGFVTGKLREAAGANRAELERLASMLDGQPIDATGQIAPNRTCTLVGLTVGPEAVDVILKLTTTPAGR